MGCVCLAAQEDHSGRRDIRDVYKLGKLLGSGSFGQVRVCIRKDTGETFAVKVMQKEPSKAMQGGNNVDFVNMFRNEVAMLEKLDHPHVIRHVDDFEDRHFLYCVMEKCNGGELFLQIVQRQTFTEADAAKLACQMVHAVSYIHKMRIVHRDVKAENFLFGERLPDSSSVDFDQMRLVLIDFGMSTRVLDDRYLKQLCGSPHYVAPELIQRNYRFEVDIWALGVVIYLMLYGRYPFEGKTQKVIVNHILKGEPDYARGKNPPSEMAVDFMRRMLCKDPRTRITADEAMGHPWISPTNLETLKNYNIDDSVLKTLRNTSADRIHSPRIVDLNQNLAEPDQPEPIPSDEL